VCSERQAPQGLRQLVFYTSDGLKPCGRKDFSANPERACALPSFLCPAVECFAAEIGTCMAVKSRPPGGIDCDCLSMYHRKAGQRGIFSGGIDDFSAGGGRWPNSHEARNGIWIDDQTGARLGLEPRMEVPWLDMWQGNKAGLRKWIAMSMREANGMIAGPPPSLPG